MLHIALAKGRLTKEVAPLLAASGYACPDLLADHRRLIFDSEEGTARYFLVKPSDVPIYVEHGAADIGIVGKDILLEQQPEVYELLDLGLGCCQMCVAAREDYQEQPQRPLRVASKFVHIAQEYYRRQNREIELIQLHGSIELAPLLGLADVIVDLVQTGTTIRENHLRLLAQIMPISARLIANKAGFKFKNAETVLLVERLQEQLAASGRG